MSVQQSVTTLSREKLAPWRDTYRKGLVDDVLPFWLSHAMDWEQGGYQFYLTREGNIYNPDKPIWLHGRFVWLLSTLYDTVERRPDWLNAASHGITFLRKHGFDRDGRMFFLVDRAGRPLRKRRYLFSEAFTVMALAAYAKAAKEDQAAQEAMDLFRLMLRYHNTPGLLEPKWNEQTRPMKGLVMPMILMSVAQVLREMVDDPLCTEEIDHSIAEIERDFMKSEFEAVLETTCADGSFLDTCEGRLLTPGHAIECAWFILHEAKYRRDDAMRAMGLRMLDWMWQWGWDGEYGGIIYYRDVKHQPPTEYWHDMKFWWPQNEAMIATLLAYQLTGDAKYARWHEMCHDWAYQHFPDPDHGEWYGYLHRDGRVSTTLKGNTWKGPFHLPRMQWYAWRLLEEMLGEVEGGEGR